MLNIFSYLFTLTSQSQVTNNQGTNWSSNLKILGQFFFLIIVFIIIVFAAIYVTKLIGGIKYNRTKNANIKLVESMPIGINNTLHLIKAGDKLFIIGVSKDRICYLTDIDSQTIKLPEPINNKLNFTFEQQLKSMMGKLMKNKENANDSSDDESE